jgi:hypothetical protein
VPLVRRASDSAALLSPDRPPRSNIIYATSNTECLHCDVRERGLFKPEDPPRGRGDVLADQRPDKNSRITIMVTVITVLGTLGVAAIAIVPQLLDGGSTNSRPPPPTVSTSDPDQPNRTATAPATGAGVICTPELGEEVAILNVQSTDGNEVIGGQLAITLKINRPPPPGATYWLMARLPEDPRPLEFAREMLGEEKSQTVRLTISSGVGSARTFYVAESGQSTSAWFKENHDRDGDNLWDTNRVSLPAGVKIVSNSCEVTRGR